MALKVFLHFYLNQLVMYLRMYNFHFFYILLINKLKFILNQTHMMNLLDFQWITEQLIVIKYLHFFLVFI